MENVITSNDIGSHCFQDIIYHCIETPDDELLTSIIISSLYCNSQLSSIYISSINDLQCNLMSYNTMIEIDLETIELRSSLRCNRDIELRSSLRCNRDN